MAQINSITLKVKEVNEQEAILEVTIEEARALYQELFQLFNKEAPFSHPMIVPSQPFIRYCGGGTAVDPNRPPHEFILSKDGVDVQWTTCGCSMCSTCEDPEKIY